MGSDRVVALSRSVFELAAYAQADIPLTRSLRVVPGLRLFTTRAESELAERDPGSTQFTEARLGVSPSLSLSWQATPDRELFLRYAGASRPAGLGPSESGAPAQFSSDRLETVELGGRARNAARTFSAEGAIYYALWHDLQSDYLLSDGLIATHNAGNATIPGFEATLSWQFAPRWHVEAGATAQHARLESGIASGGDRRLPIVPDLSGRASLVRTFSWHGWGGTVEAGVNVTGSSRLSFDPNLDRRSPPYAVGSAALSFERNRWRLGIEATNLFGSRADTFGFGNPFTILNSMQFTPLEPLRVTVSLRRSFGR
jgi:outer membrane receptor protein involved in Fe transport